MAKNEDVFDRNPVAFVDQNSQFPVLNDKVGFEYQQLKTLVENTNYLYNNLGLASMDIESVETQFPTPGSFSDVVVSHRVIYIDHKPVDLLSFLFKIPTPRIQATLTSEVAETVEAGSMSLVTEPIVEKIGEMRVTTGYQFKFHAIMPQHAHDYVQYIVQSLTEQQQQQARANIGAGIGNVIDDNYVHTDNNFSDTYVEDVNLNTQNRHHHDNFNVLSAIEAIEKIVNNSDNPVSSGAVLTALNEKVDKIVGKGLSTNDFTTDYKNKLDGIEEKAQKNVQSDWFQTDKNADDYIKNKPVIPSGVILYEQLGQNRDGAITQKLATDEYNKKVDKESGKGLSSNDYTTEEKTKLSGIEYGANKTIVDSTITQSSTNPVSSSALYTRFAMYDGEFDKKVDKVNGKGLSTNDFTDSDKNKLDGIEVGADKSVQSNWEQTDETAKDYIKNKPIIPSGVKLYDTTGYNTDGAMTQNATTVELEKKANSDDLRQVAYSGSYKDLQDLPKVLLYENQALLESEKEIARNNIGAGTSNFNGDFNSLVNKPTKLSDFENDTDFVNKTAENLENYYLKSQTYTKTETYSKEQVDDLISQIEKIEVVIVTELPETGQTNKIYLLKRQTNDDYYDEYLWIVESGIGRWEKIGDTKIDLSDYYKKSETYSKTETDVLLNEKANSADLSQVATSGSYNDLIDKPEISEKIQYDVMPTPSEEYLGRTIQFVGSAGEYLTGSFYRCYKTEEDSYIWDRIRVDPLDVALSTESKNAVQNNVITAKVNQVEETANNADTKSDDAVSKSSTAYNTAIQAQQSATDTNNKLQDITLTETSDNTYKLWFPNYQKVIGEMSFKDQHIDSITQDFTKDKVTFHWNRPIEGYTKQEYEVNLSNYKYTKGKGLSLNNNEFSAYLANNSKLFFNNDALDVNLDGYLTKDDVINTLDSTETQKPVSAYQAKLLNDKKQENIMSTIPGSAMQFLARNANNDGLIFTDSAIAKTTIVYELSRFEEEITFNITETDYANIKDNGYSVQVKTSNAYGENIYYMFSAFDKVDGLDNWVATSLTHNSTDDTFAKLVITVNKNGTFNGVAKLTTGYSKVPKYTLEGTVLTITLPDDDTENGIMLESEE